MQSQLTHDQVLELLPAYVLGILEPEEMLAVEDYLAQHPELHVRLAEIEETAAQLAYLAPDAPLPSGTKSRLLAQVRADGPGPPGSPQPRAAGQRAATPILRILPRRLLGRNTDPDDLLGRRRRLSGSGFFAAAAAAALLLVSLYAFRLGAQLSTLRGQFSTTQNEVAQLRAANTELQQAADEARTEAGELRATNVELREEIDVTQAEVADLQAANAELQESNLTLEQQLAADREQLVLLANARQAVLLSGTESAPAASGAFYVSEREGVLVVRGLEPLAEEQAYQLWLIPAEGQPVSAGLLPLREAGPTWQTVAIPDGARDFAGFGISIEPALGSPAPTGPIVLLGQVT